ncbi:MAG: dihydrodipicolinate synthase family protein [Ruminococcaceae bacterium]|nr:dihydrodipicolinate synthase family protein [Oscillospiraceae bacterium]
MKMGSGFIPALGTPLDENCQVIAESLKKQINMQIEAGAQGLLCMGSMGVEPTLDTKAYVTAAKAAVEANAGRVPLFIGAMDNSVSRVKERCELLKGLDFDGIVLTTPFYGKQSDAYLVDFFKGCADVSEKPVYLYDLAVSTGQKITYPMVVELMKHPNIKGIKTGDIVLARQLHVEYPEFNVMFSNIDIFDVARTYGLPRVLDGMFSCTPKNAAAFEACIKAGDLAGAQKHLNNILKLRDTMLPNGLWPAFTIAMNLLGLEGNYSWGGIMNAELPDEKEVITNLMREIGEIA